MNFYPVLQEQGPQKVVHEADEKRTENSERYRDSETLAQEDGYRQGSPDQRAADHRHERTEQNKKRKEKSSLDFENREYDEGRYRLVKRHHEKSHEQILRNVPEFIQELFGALRIDGNGGNKQVSEIMRVQIEEIQGETDKAQRDNKIGQIFCDASGEGRY
jgi:hypothetical protein